MIECEVVFISPRITSQFRKRYIKSVLAIPAAAPGRRLSRPWNITGLWRGGNWRSVTWRNIHSLIDRVDWGSPQQFPASANLPAADPVQSLLLRQRPPSQKIERYRPSAHGHSRSQPVCPWFVLLG